jgi:hypothetical protein
VVVDLAALRPPAPDGPPSGPVRLADTHLVAAP